MNHLALTVTDLEVSVDRYQRLFASNLEGSSSGSTPPLTQADDVFQELVMLPTLKWRHR